MEFSGRTAIITGAASGIGLLTARRMAAQGANVVLADINGDGVKATAGEICSSGGEATGVKVDVTDYDQIAEAVELTIRKYGRIDILVNNAGGSPSRVFGRSESFKDRDIKLLDWGIDVNLKGALYFSRAVIGNMIEHKNGVIVNMGSIEGVTGSEAVEYSAAKSGMIGLTKSLALYGARHGVRACCVSPGPVLTRPSMAQMKTPLGRAAQPEEVCDLILYLCSDKAAFITGSHHLIDGGRSCGTL